MDRSLTENRFRWYACSAVGLMLLATLAGCGGETAQSYDDSDEGLLDAAVSSVFGTSESTVPSEIARWESLFPDGKAPTGAEKEKYAAYGSYRLSPGSAVISGDTATAKVIVEEKETEKVIETMDWKFTKIAGEWKITDSPLP